MENCAYDTFVMSKSALHSILYHRFDTKNMMAFLRYGNRFRAQRRLMQQHFNSQAISSFRPLQYVQVSAFLKNILASPEEFIDHANRYVQFSQTGAHKFSF